MTTTPPGWYPDPTAPTPTLRWWDGVQWTDHTSPLPAAAPDPVAPTGEKVAGWGARLGAYVIDYAILAIPIGIPAAFFVIDWQLGMFDRFEELDRLPEEEANAMVGDVMRDFFGGFFLAMLAVTAVSVTINAVYHAIFLRWRGATPGKMALKLRVVPDEGTGPLTWRHIGLRVGSQYVLFGLLSIVYAALIDGLWPLWDKRRQALHDKIGSTLVVEKARDDAP